MQEFHYLSNPDYTRTGNNLVTAFCREAKASARYAIFAKRAKQEGYRSVASLFDACASSNQIHAVRHAKVALFMGTGVNIDIKPVQEHDIPDMLRKMLEFETLANLIYPNLIEDALDEENDLAVLSFKRAMKAQKTHVIFCQQALDSPDLWQSERKMFRVCVLCGYTRDDNNDLCPSCGGDHCFLKF